MTRRKVPWEPEIIVEVRDKKTYIKPVSSPFEEEASIGLRKNSVCSEEPLNTEFLIEDYVFRLKSGELYKKALLGDIQSGQELSKFVTERVAKKQKLDLEEEAYFQRAMRAIAEGEEPNVAFLTARKNGYKDGSHIPDRDQWIYDEIWNLLDSGKKFSEATNSIHNVMVDFHVRAESELAEAEESGIVQRVEDAKRLLRINKPLTPERIGDIFEEQGIKLRRETIDIYLAFRALRKKSKKE